MNIFDLIEKILFSDKLLVGLLFVSAILGFIAAGFSVSTKEYRLLFAPIIFPMAAYVFWVCVVLFVCFLMVLWNALMFIIK